MGPIAFDFFKNVKGSEFNDTLFFGGASWSGWQNQSDLVGAEIGRNQKIGPHIYWNQWGSMPTALKQQFGTPDKFKETWQPIKPPAPLKPEVLHNQNVLEWQNQ